LIPKEQILACLAIIVTGTGGKEPIMSVRVRIIAPASTGIALALVFGSGTAHADPPGTTPNDQHNAYLVCAALDENPSVQGLRAVMSNMFQGGLSPDDGADGVAYAVLYTCPWYKGIVGDWLSQPA
jgi:hypothetical protein